MQIVHSIQLARSPPDKLVYGIVRVAAVRKVELRTVPRDLTRRDDIFGLSLLLAPFLGPSDYIRDLLLPQKSQLK